MTTGIRKPGEFCWINILTPEPAAAREFFGRLLGWTWVEIPGMGHRVQVGGEDVGAIFDLGGPQVPPGTPAGIGVMVKVEDADATAERAKVLGGRAKPAFDIGPQGRMAECYDPNGANIDLWQPGTSPGTEVDSSRHGAPTWFETLTTDTGRAASFYTALLGWTAEDVPMEGFTYTVFKLDGEPVAGMMAITPEMGDFPPHWGTYFAVDDVDATARQALALGATQLLPPADIPGVGRFCYLVSPQGVHFYAITHARPA
jgi:hypothetical protein